MNILIRQILAGRARRNHERDQMFFARVRPARARRTLPLHEFRGALLWVGRACGVGEPGVKAIGFRIWIYAELPQIVIAHTAAGDQHALASQWSEGAAKCDMSRWIQACFQGELNDGYVGIRDRSI